MIESLATNIIDTPQGGTHRVDGHTMPTDGYLVGGIVSPLIFRDTPDHEVDREELEFFLWYLKDIVEAPYIGWWTDEETGVVYVDGTTWTASYNHAEALCRDRNEIAFYDIKRGRSFRPVLTTEGN